MKLLIHKNASENIVCKIAAILSTGDDLNAPRGFIEFIVALSTIHRRNWNSNHYMVSRYKDFFLQFFSQQVYNVSANGGFLKRVLTPVDSAEKSVFPCLTTWHTVKAIWSGDYV